MKYVIDSYSWIDYLEGCKEGQKVKEIIENNDNEIITNILNVSELASFFKRKNIDFESSYKIIISLSKVYNFNTEFAKEAGILHAEVRKNISSFGIVDAFVLLTAKKINAKIITGDRHFKSFKEAILTR